MFQRKEKYHVYITHNTYRGMLLEAGRHPGKESIIQMPGLRIGNSFYFDMVADSGINATYTFAMCEKDHVYTDHLSTRLGEYYDFSNGKLTVSQVHRHPDGYLHFSPGDYPANIKLAQQFGGVVNGLIFIDPEFRVKFWYIDENGEETEAEYEINDEAVRAAMPRINLNKLKKNVEHNEATYKVVRKTERRTSGESKVRGTIRSRLSDLFRGHPEEERYMVNRTADVLQAVEVATESVPTETVSIGAEVTEDISVDNITDDETSEEALMDLEMMQEVLRPYTVLIPEEYRKQRYEGELRGYYHQDTKTYNIVEEKLYSVRTDAKALGKAVRKEHMGRESGDTSGQFGLFIVWDEEQAEISIRDNAGAEINIDYYSTSQDVFSRNQGIVEQDRMATKQAIISGTGSGGFMLGLQLVRSGIGSLILADDDILAYHNVCRHECGIHDVGRYKVDCFKERAADINPGCKVYTFRELIQHVDPAELEKLIWKDSIILCCADNRHCGYVCNQLADKYGIPMIDAGCGPRASTGEVFWYKPNSGMACYTCAYGEDKGVDYSNQAVRRRFYATESELEKLHFQPGMYLDIQLTAIFCAKLAIDILMEQEAGYEAKLLPYINQCTVLLNYPVDQDVNPYMQLFGAESERKPLTWKSGPAKKSESCSYCGTEKVSPDVGCNTVA
jgi:molybdopterin/thiamine biosynthesis adenylyltransferase